ncbi:MAG: Holliday junction branch migration protein RuvA [Lachnospiraceae bacterium]|nr:Holliday junction branch migration protein RuvA [Lachnospiraceae bacterium]
MIGFVEGTVDTIGENQAVINVNGVGFVVNIGSGTASEMPSVGDQVKLYTYMSVREDDMSLFGFLHRDELELFKMLIKVSGIGPKGAQSVLSVMSASDLRFAILTGDVKAITRAPGVAAKTAQKLILELKDKIGKTVGEDSGYGGTEQSFSGGKVVADERTEAAEALIALGYSQTEAYRAVKAADAGEGADAEAILKAALKFL